MSKNRPDNAPQPAGRQVNIDPSTDGPDSKPDEATGQTGTTADKSAISGKKNDDPTRYGDWVKNGRCIDF